MVDSILGKNLIDHHVRAVVSLQRKIVFHDLRAVAFLGTKQFSTETISDANRFKTGAVNDLPTSRKVRLVSTVTALTVTQVTVRVSIPTADLRFLRNYPRKGMGHLTLIAQGVADVIPHQPFGV